MMKRARTDDYNPQQRPVHLGGRPPQQNNADTAFEFATILNSDDQLAIAVRDMVNHILDQPSNVTQSIPSPLPATLSRRDLPRFLREKTDYVVCEKSDGERALMLICEHGCFLMNRKFQIQRVKDETLGLYQNLVPKGSGKKILLDGEVIVNYWNPEADHLTKDDRSKRLWIPSTLKQAVKDSKNVDAYLFEQAEHERHCYLMFDCVYFEDQDVQQQNLRQRLEYCRALRNRANQYVLGKMKEIYKDDESVKHDGDLYQRYFSRHATLRIEIKDFSHTASMMGNLLQCVMRFPQDKGYMYYNENKQLKSKNDGFIFTPVNNDYMMRRDPEKGILKYKWPNLNTADFHIANPWFDETGKLILCCHGAMPEQPGRKVDFEFTRIDLSPESKEYLLHNVADKSVAVVECNYDAATGRWVIKHIRTDKHKGNFFSTVLSCMEAMIDNLKPEELADKLR